MTCSLEQRRTSLGMCFFYFFPSSYFWLVKLRERVMAYLVFSPSVLSLKIKNDFILENLPSFLVYVIKFFHAKQAIILDTE